MSNTTLMFQAIEFIEARLQEEVTVTDMAGAVSCSLYHFCRVFNRTIHHTPYDYLMRRRLSESARELIETDQKIIDIAFAYRFNSAETYARAFKRMFGMQPTQWRKQGQIPPRRLMPRLSLAHIEHLNQGSYLKAVPVEKEGFHVTGLMTLVKEGREGIADLWQILEQELSREESNIPGSGYYGLVWYPQDWPQRGFFYMAGVEIESSISISPALAVKTIPATKYARFIHKGPDHNLNLTLDYIYHTWLPKSGCKPAYPLEIEYYGPDFRGIEHDEQAERGVYIPIEE